MHPNYNLPIDFAAMQKVRLERPARELMLLCILLGKLKLALLFWGYEKASFVPCLLHGFKLYSPSVCFFCMRMWQ